MNNLFMKEVPDNLEFELRLTLSQKAFNYFFEEELDRERILGYFPIKTPDKYFRMEYNGKFYGVIVFDTHDTTIKIFSGRAGVLLTKKDFESLRDSSIETIKTTINPEIIEELDLC